MEREQFDRHIMDFLDGVLSDELRAEMDQAMAADSELARTVAELRATLEVAQLPLEKPSDSLEVRILDAIDNEPSSTSPWQRLLQAISWAGSMAMRPQFAMAALLVLVLGSSVLLLRARPGTLPSSATKDPAAQAPMAKVQDDTAPQKAEAEAPRPAAGAPNEARSEPAEGKLDTPEASRAFKRAIANYQRGNYEQARREFALVRASNSINASQAALYEARAVRSLKGCGEAVAVFARVRKKYKLKDVGADAAYEEADCHHTLGNKARWRGLLVALSEHPRYGARAIAELNDAAASKPDTSALAQRGTKTAARAKRSGKGSRPASEAKPKRPKAKGSKTTAPASQPSLKSDQAL